MDSHLFNFSSQYASTAESSGDGNSTSSYHPRSDSFMGSAGTIGSGIGSGIVHAQKNSSVIPAFTKPLSEVAPATGSLWDTSYRLNHGRVSNPPSFQQPQKPSPVQSSHWPVRAEQAVSSGPDPAIQDLKKELEAKEVSISKLKMEIEALVTAMTLGQAPDTNLDAAEIAHRMLSRLRSLQNENERLSNLASRKATADLEIQVDVLKQENVELKRQLQQR